jgi:hypothetical protein
MGWAPDGLVAVVVLIWLGLGLKVGSELRSTAARSLVQDNLTALWQNASTGLPRNSALLLLVGVCLAAVTLSGVALLRLIGVRAELPDELAIGFCLGHVVATTVMFTIGHTLGLSTPAVVGAFVLVTAASGVVLWHTGWRPTLRRRRRAERVGHRRDRWLCAALLAVLVVLLVFPLLGSLSPEVNWDAKWYHLGPARHYVDEGRFYDTLEVNRMAVTALGSYQEALYTGLYSVHGQVAAKLLNLFQLLATCGLLVVTARRFTGRAVIGLAAAVGYVAIPVVTWSAATAYNDTPLGLLTAGVLYALVAHRTGGGRRWVAVAGLLCGYAIGVKLFGVFTLAGAAVIALWPPTWSRREATASIRLGVGMGVAAFVGWLPALIRAAWLTGNPVFPLLSGLFPSPYWNASADQRTADSLAAVSLHELPVLLVRLPYDLIVDAGDRNTLAGPAMFILIPVVAVAVLAFGKRRDALSGPAAVLGAIWTVLWLKSGVSDSRYLVAAWPALALALASAAFHVRWRRRRLAAGSALVALGVVATIGVQPIAPILVHSSPSETAGLMSVMWEYLYQHQPEREVQLRWLPTVEMINAELDAASDKVFDDAGIIRDYLYVDPEIYNGSAYEGPVGLRQWSLCNADAPWRLAEADVTHVVSTPAHLALLQASVLWTHLVEVARVDGGDILFRFDASSVGPEPADVDGSFCDYASPG